MIKPPYSPEPPGAGYILLAIGALVLAAFMVGVVLGRGS